MTTPQIGTCIHRVIATIVATLALVFPSVAAAQSAGIVSGRVSNAGTAAYLDGAVVTLDPGNHSALTTSTGAFVFENIPPGSYTLTASYTGLDT